MDADQEQQADAAVPLGAAPPGGSSSEPQEHSEAGERGEMTQAGPDTYVKVSQSADEKPAEHTVTTGNGDTTITERDHGGEAPGHSVTTQTGPDTFTTVTEKDGAIGGGPSTQGLLDSVGNFFGVKSEGNEVEKGVGFIENLEQKAIGGIDTFEDGLHKQTARDGGGVAGDVMNFVGDLGGGVAKGGIGLVGGMAKMVADPMGAIGGLVNMGGAVADAVGGDTDGIKAIGQGIIDPMAKSWEQGKYGDAIGQGAVQAMMALEGANSVRQIGKSLLKGGGEAAVEAGEAGSQAARAAGEEALPQTLRSPGVEPPPPAVEPVPIEPAPTTVRTGEPPPAIPERPAPTPMPEPVPAGPKTLRSPGTPEAIGVEQELPQAPAVEPAPAQAMSPQQRGQSFIDQINENRPPELRHTDVEVNPAGRTQLDPRTGKITMGENMGQYAEVSPEAVASHEVAHADAMRAGGVGGDMSMTARVPHNQGGYALEEAQANYRAAMEPGMPGANDSRNLVNLGNEEMQRAAAQARATGSSAYRPDKGEIYMYMERPELTGPARAQPGGSTQDLNRLLKEMDRRKGS